MKILPEMTEVFVMKSLFVGKHRMVVPR